MKIYHSKITRHIFSNLEKEDKIVITQTNGKNIRSTIFKENILNLSKNLSEIGFSKDTKIAIFIKDNILFSNIIISSILCGSHVVLLDPSMGRKILIEKIKSSKITHIFIEGILYDYLFLTQSEILKMNTEFIVKGISIFGRKKIHLSSLQKINTQTHSFENNTEDTEIFTVFTGGTTGSPKGVIHSLNSIYNTLCEIQKIIGNTKVFYADMPHFLLLGLLNDAHIISGTYEIKSKKLQSIIEKFQIDTYFCPPYKYNYFIENNIKIPKNLKNILLGSAPIYNGFLEKLIKITTKNQKITCIYGMTEILPIAYIDGKQKVKMKVKGDLLGNFIPNIDYKIINNELLVKGPHTCIRYLGYEIKDFIETGDYANIQDNMLVMLGRKKDMIIKKDFNIYPGLYEPIISKIPGVRNCALIGFYDEKINDEKIILCIEKRNKENKINKNNILNYLKSGKFSIDNFALPDEIFFTEIPRIGRQKKIDKQKLKLLYSYYKKLGK